MKRVVLILLLLATVMITFSCCSANPTQTSPPATEPSTAPATEPSVAPTIDPNKPLTELTDYELLCAMGEKDALNIWNTSSYYLPPYDIYTLILGSPEFAELITRPTIVDSIKTHIVSLYEMYPGCAFDGLEVYIPQIEAYTSDASDARKELTDYELLRIMAEKRVVLDLATMSYMGEYQFSCLIGLSPEFAELMTRPTAAESIKTHVPTLMMEFQTSGIMTVHTCLPFIEMYLSKNVTK